MLYKDKYIRNIENPPIAEPSANSQAVPWNDIFKEYPDVVSVSQLQKMLSIGRNTAYQLIAEQKIPHVRVGNQIRIAKISVIAFLEAGK